MDAAAVIFDMDGVIIDSEPLHYRVEGQLFRELGLEIATAEHETFLGMSSADMWRRIGETRPLPRPIDELVQLERQRYRQAAREGVPEVPGAVELIRHLAATGVPLAVASSAPLEQIRDTLKVTETEGLFRVQVSGDEVARSKPDPAIFLEAARRLGVAPGGCLVIEDSENGRTAAHAAGMRCLFYGPGGFPSMRAIAREMGVPEAKKKAPPEGRPFVSRG